MKIWLTKNSEVTVHQQLIAQISIGVAAQDLKIGEKLPSTRELARRFKIHQNTVSNAYHELAEQGWLEFRPGSGFYVPEKKLENFPDELDQIIAKFFQTAQSQGFTLSEIQARLPRFFEIQPPHHFLVVESDEGLREILRAEISQATNYQVRGVNFDEFKKNRK